MDKTEYMKLWREKNRERYKEYLKKYHQEYYLTHKEEREKYRKSKIGRASNLLQAYKTNDKRFNRGECDFDAKWIVENIFSKPCAHCGETDWTKIGCNRLNNDLPHTKDNVEPCCLKCNKKIETMSQMKKVYQYTLDNELVKIWNSTNECGRNGFDQGAVSKCCTYQTIYKGYRWSYKPL